MVGLHIIQGYPKTIKIEEVSVISNDPPLIEWDVRLIKVPLKALSDHSLIRHQCFCFWKMFIFFLCCLCKSELRIFSSEIIRTKHFLSYIIIRLWFKGHCCKSGMPLFKVWTQAGVLTLNDRLSSPDVIDKFYSLYCCIFRVNYYPQWVQWIQ